MIERLLRAFPQYRRLDAQFRTLASAKVLADDELRRLRAQNEDLREQLVAALRDGNAARETVANWIAQYSFGKVVFGPLALPADDPTETPPMRHRLHGRDLVRRSGPVYLKDEPDDSRTDPAVA